MIRRDPGSVPDHATLIQALRATWPPERVVRGDGWALGVSTGGQAEAGSRVNCLTPDDPDAALSDTARDAAVAAAQAEGLSPLWAAPMESRSALASQLVAEAWAPWDPTAFWVAPAVPVDLTDAAKGVRVMALRAPVAAAAALWAEGGVGPQRRAIMDRVRGRKLTLLARDGADPAGLAFAALCETTRIGFVHAVHVASTHRRRGVGRALMRAAQVFLRGSGAGWTAVAVRVGNAEAEAIYAASGFERQGAYAYYRRPDDGG